MVKLCMRQEIWLEVERHFFDVNLSTLMQRLARALPNKIPESGKQATQCTSFKSILLRCVQLQIA